MPENRERWTSRSAFILAAVGSAVGLGNVWRFPYVTYENGGGAFLIPYFLAMFTAGIPLLILEYSLGQRMQGATPKAMKKVSPKWEWVGWWATACGAIITFYYCAVMAWAINYLYHSFTLSWAENSSNFFYKEVLHLSSGPGDLGGISIPILLGLALTWICIFLIIFKGVKVVSKVVLITVPLPWILLIILFIRSLTLDGAIEGLGFYLTPDFSKLLNPQLWLDAYAQVFFTLSLGFGIMITYASFRPRKGEISNNAFITALADGGTSFFAGMVVFTTLGFLANTKGVPIDEVAKSGPGLAFVVYPEAIANLPVMPQLFAVFFFLMLLTLGIDSAFSIVEAVVTGIRDKWKFPKEKVAAGFCIFGFFMGLIFTTHAGLYWLDIVDHWINNFGITVMGLLECILIGYVFNIGDMRNFINSVSEIKLGRWWEICICYITPIALGITIFLNFVRELTGVELIGYLIKMLKNAAYEGYPLWALIIAGWGVAIGCAVIGILIARMEGTNKEDDL